MPQGLFNSQKTHCPRGHEYTPENTRIQVRANGVKSRKCRECQRLSDEGRREEKRLQIAARRSTVLGRLAYRATDHRMRARKAGVECDPNVDLFGIAERDDWTCQECGERLNPMAVCFDHIVPMFHGGPNRADNIEVCCVPCNVKRWRRDKAAHSAFGKLGAAKRWGWVDPDLAI